jgi:hypothetical protein
VKSCTYFLSCGFPCETKRLEQVAQTRPLVCSSLNVGEGLHRYYSHSPQELHGLILLCDFCKFSLLIFYLSLRRKASLPPVVCTPLGIQIIAPCPSFPSLSTSQYRAEAKRLLDTPDIIFAPVTLSIDQHLHRCELLRLLTFVTSSWPTGTPVQLTLITVTLSTSFWSKFISRRE